MELKEFVRQSLVQIVEGVEAAKEELKGRDVFINPYADDKNTIDKYLKYRKVQDIEMNISVVTDSKTDNGQGGSIKVLDFSLGYDAKSNKELKQSNVSSLKFSVPISLPAHNIDNEPSWYI